MARLCVFCGSRSGSEAGYERLASTLGRTIAEEGHTLVYGGGGIGMMGIVADAVIAHGGGSLGVMPESLTEKEVGHAGLDRLEVVPDMLSRKRRMIELADGFITLPGGLGTLDELFEVLTWSQLGLIDKPLVLLDDNHYFQAILEWLDHAVDQSFMDAIHRDRLIVCRDPGEAVRVAAGRSEP